MLDFKDLQALVRLFEASPLACLELHGPGGHLRLAKPDDKGTAGIGAVPDAPPAAAATGSETVAAVAPLAGVFLATHPMRTEPLAAVGARVRSGDIVGLTKCGPLLVPVTAPADGVVDRLLVADGAMVGYGAPVLAIGGTSAGVSAAAVRPPVCDNGEGRT